MHMMSWMWCEFTPINVVGLFTCPNCSHRVPWYSWESNSALVFVLVLKKIIHFCYCMVAMAMLNWCFMSSGIISVITCIHMSINNFAPEFGSLAQMFISRDPDITFHSKNSVVLLLLWDVQMQAWVKFAWQAVLKGTVVLSKHGRTTSVEGFTSCPLPLNSCPDVI